MSYSGIGEVIYNKKVGPEHFLMRVYVPELTKLAKPGQFVHVRCNDLMDPLLRRPISLNGIDYQKGTVSLLYQVVGRGTQIFSELPVGAEIDIMGPLGRGFTIPDKIQHVLVVGGGIGVAPLFPLVQSLKRYGISQTALLGARTSDFIIGADQIESLGIDVELATDDGSTGYRGFVTDLFERQLKMRKPDYFFACGPNVMLKSLTETARRYGVNGQVSLEEIMGCGVGACLACVCKTVTGKDFEYKKVCTDGPVFEASEVIFDE